MMKRKNTFIFVLSALGMAACGGGGGSPQSAGPSGTDTIPVTHLFYRDNSLPSPLMAIDPVNAAAPVAADAGAVAGAERVLYGNYNPSSRTVSALHPRSVIYAKGGKLYRVSAIKGAGFTPIQVSSETQSAEICRTKVDIDFANHDKSTYLYSSKGADGQCSTADDQWKMVRLGMSATDVPIVVPVVITPASSEIIALNDPTTGALIGFLGVNGSSLYRYDANFGNPFLLLSNVDAYEPVEADMFDRVFLAVDSGGNRTIHAYNVLTGVLSNSVYSSPIEPFVRWSYASDTSQVFISNGRKIFSLPLTAGALASMLVDEGSNRIEEILLTNTKVAYVLTEGVNQKFKTVAKSDRVAFTYFTMPTDSGTLNQRRMELYAAGGDWVYYNKVNAVGSAVSAGAIKVNQNSLSNLSEKGGAGWVGKRFPATFANGFVLPSLFRAEGPEMASGNYKGATINTYDTASNLVTATLGVLPLENIRSVELLAWDDNVLGEVRFEATLVGTSQIDIFFANARKEGSLVRVTNTPQSEVPSH